MLLDEIIEPGAYVCHRGGELIRVVRTESSLDLGDAHLIEQYGNRQIPVVRISEDPFVAVSRARIAAANLDIEVNF
jgi:hypothetical protein